MINLYNKEMDVILQSLKKRAKTVWKLLNNMKNITCNEVEGAMYAFPSIKFSQGVNFNLKFKGIR